LIKVPASFVFARIQSTNQSIILQPLEEEEEDYKLWPANKSDCLWQSLSNPA